MRQQSHTRGFTLIETVVAIFVMTLMLTGVYALVARSLASLADATNEIVAAYLAQEGIEVVKNLRDTSYINSEDWRDRIPPGGPYALDYRTETLDPSNCSDTRVYQNLATGVYSCENIGNATRFSREVTITDAGIDQVEVAVAVLWNDRGRDRSVVITQHLYDWFQAP